MQYMLCCGAMTGDEAPDKIIREREFKLPSGIKIDSLDVSTAEKPEESSSIGAEKMDEAIGEVFDPFSESGDGAPGRVGEDGSVSSPPERDLVSQISIEGEERVNWVIMVSMIVLYSAISIQIGRVFDSVVGTLLLICLAGVGFGLGEIWVPRKRMSLLGVTWVIISMKVVYGLAIELRQWGVIDDDLSLGVVLIFLVGVNIFVAYRHNHDAIAAQSTLVLLAVGSTAGTEFGEVGVAGMILVATVVVHSIALNRSSGNLASLGIASSNLWIGMHAVTSRFSVGPLEVLPIEGSLLLFLLLMAVTAMNAFMATKFAREENWFSKGFETLGLGKPGLWGVSISLGMIGALMAVASNRDDLGYALGMVTFLGGAFGGSYLVVRGVGARRVYFPLVVTASLLTIMLVNGNSVDEFLGVSAYQVFTLVGSSVTIAIILRDQNSVTDRVLWIGSVAILAILVLLVPTGTKEDGDGGAVLLGMLALLHIGTATLAIRRSSPSLSGVTVLLPWAWLLVEKLIEETVRTVMLANDISDFNGWIELETTPLAIYLGMASVLLFIVNSRMGESGVNLASGFLGITEISATIRDSGMLNLWSIGLWLPMLTIILLAQFGGFTTFSLVALLALLSGLHVSSLILGLRDGEGIVWALALTFLVVQWRHGLDEAVIVLMCISLALIMHYGEDRFFTLGMGMMSIPMLVLSTDRVSSVELVTPDWFNRLETGSIFGSLPEAEVFALLSSVVMLAIFLPRAEGMDSILKPASSALILIVITNVLSMDSGSLFLQVASGAVFAAASIWLISRGEIRSELRTIAKRDSIVGMIADSGISRGGSLTSYNPKVAEMEELRREKREFSETDDVVELLTSEVTHTPVVGLVILGIVLAGITLSSAMGSGPLILIFSGFFCCIIVFLIRNRTRGLELELPHFLGMEMPIALTISGLCIILVSGHVFPPGSSPYELLDMAVVSVLVMVLLMVSLLHQSNLLDRISIAIDWFVLPLLLARIVAIALGGALPAPMTVDPFSHELLDWTVPWLILESILILCVLVGFWVDEKKEDMGRDHGSNGVGIGSRSLAIMMMSFGPAGFLAASSAAFRSIRTAQPSGLGIAMPVGVLACFSLIHWNGGLSATTGFLGWLVLFLGIGVMVACALTVPLNMEKWTVTLAIDGHLFIISGAIMLGMMDSFEIPLLLILMSTTIWVVGILQLRKSLRVWGLADLIAAILCSFIFATKGFGQYEILVGMAALALELGIIAWLGLSNQDELRRD